MKPLDKIFRIIILLMGLVVIGFNMVLYNFCEQQKNAMVEMSGQQKADADERIKKFKYQQDQITQLSKDLQDAKDQIKSQADNLSEQKDQLSQQKSAFVQEIQKRQQLENANKNVQKILTDIEAEADAIKQDMTGWQKDYVAVLADLEKKIDLSRQDIKHVQDNLTVLDIPGLKDSISSLRAQVELLNHPAAPAIPAIAPAELIQASGTGSPVDAGQTVSAAGTDSQNKVHEIDYHY